MRQLTKTELAAVSGAGPKSTAIPYCPAGSLPTQVVITTPSTIATSSLSGTASLSPSAGGTLQQAVPENTTVAVTCVAATIVQQTCTTPDNGKTTCTTTVTKTTDSIDAPTPNSKPITTKPTSDLDDGVSVGDIAGEPGGEGGRGAGDLDFDDNDVDEIG